MTRPRTLRAPEQLRADLISSGWLSEGGADGLYHRSATFEAVVAGLRRRISALLSAPDMTELHFPPVIARRSFVRTDYLRSFPDLIGSIETFAGGDAEHARLLALLESGGDWTEALVPSEIMLCSAICHSLYPSLAGRVVDGSRYECHGHAFRHEPSRDPARMQSFRMHEFVYVGSGTAAAAQRDQWRDEAWALLAALGLDVVVAIANDPFFGRAGRLLAANQRETALKYEILAPVSSADPTAIASANCHGDHFGVNFEIIGADGGAAHTACLGFGLERVTLALVAEHGLAVSQWPAEVCELLSLQR
jgi:seryl-tRNA synthetase